MKLKLRNKTTGREADRTEHSLAVYRGTAPFLPCKICDMPMIGIHGAEARTVCRTCANRDKPKLRAA